MTPQEAVALCRFTMASCPAQKFDEYTPDAWGLILADIRLADAKDAVVAIKQRTPWVDPSEIIVEVKKMRAKRIAEFYAKGNPEAPAGFDPDDVQAFIRWQAETEKAIADGDLKPKELDLPERPVQQLTQGAFQRISRTRRDSA